jgi:hypothetical protein
VSHRLLALCGVALLVGCIDSPRRVREAEALGSDGLERVSSRVVGASFVRPGASLAGYSRVRISLTGFEYRNPPKDVRTAPRVGGGNYALSERQEARLEREFRQAFERELIGSGLYAAAEAPGPDVLDVRGRVIDLVVDVPPEVPATQTNLVRRAGEMTMVLDVADSRSGEVLVRMADRRVISATGDTGLYVSDSVSNLAQVRKNLSRWARLLRERLEELRQGAAPAR